MSNPATTDPIETSDRLRHGLSRSLGLIAAVVLFLLMALTCIDVFGRYVLNAPVPGAAELIAQMLGVMVFLALPLVTLRDSHITIDIVDTVVPLALVPVRDIIVNLISATFLGAVAYRMWSYAGTKQLYGDITEFLHIPLYPIAYLMSAMIGLTCLLLIAFVLQVLIRTLRRR